MDQINEHSDSDSWEKGKVELDSSDLPTFYEIKVEDLPPSGKKAQNIFFLGKYSDIFICRWPRMSLFFPFLNST